MHKRAQFISLLTLLVLLISAVMPGTAYAQDPLPPPPEEATAAEVPVTEDAVAEEIPVAEPPPAEEIALPDVLAEVPAGTDVVLLDENGASLPLATNEAAEVLESGDPMWCPGTAEPGDGGCTAPHASFADLLADLADDSEVGSGTIYVSNLYSVTDDGGADAGGIFFNWGDYAVTDLVIQGGWDFGSNTLNGTSTIGAAMNFLNWGNPGNTLTLNDLDFINGGMLNIYDNILDGTHADVILENVSVTGSNSDGAYIETTGDITVSHSDFQGSSSDGLELFAGGDIELDEVDSSTAQGGDGVYGFAEGNFTITDGVFSDNYDDGITVGAGGDLTLSDVAADGNGFMGILAGAYGNTLLTNVTATENYMLGIAVGGMGDTTLNGVHADDNGLLGVAAGAIGDVSLTDVSADGNEFLGVAAIGLGDVTLNQITANENYGIGVAAAALGNTALNDVTANENGVGVVAVSLGGLPLMDIFELALGLFTGGDGGFDLYLPGDIEDLLDAAAETPATTTLNGVSANDNGLAGALVATGGNVFVSNSQFNENGMLGLGAVSLLDGDVEIFNVTAIGNEGMGVAAASLSLELGEGFSIQPSTTGAVSIACSVITGNGWEGLAAGSNTFIASNDLSGNLGGEYQSYFGAVVAEGPAVDCGTGEQELSDYMRRRLVELQATAPVCEDITLSEGGMTAVFHELCGHHVALDVVDLPGELPTGASLSSSAQVTGDLPQPEGYATLSFPMPAGGTGNLAVLFWNGTEWTEVPGGTVEDGKFVVMVKEAGIYALVQL
jgi:hypothetical protein